MHRRTRAVAVWLGVVVVALGWLQSLVVCTKACCGGHVQLGPRCELAAAATVRPAREQPACACCAAKAARSDAGGDGGAPQVRQGGCDGCAHVALGVDLDLPPEASSSGAAPVPPFVATLPPFAAATDTAARCAVHPPATGPPRCDHRAALRASTLLLL